MPGADRGRATLAAAALAAAAVLVISACSLNGYDTGGISSQQELPSASFTDYTHTVVEGGKKLLELKAASAQLYGTSKKTVLTDVRFSEYDTGSGELVSFGQADEAVYHTDTKDAEFSGSVVLESLRQDAVLRGEYLRWIDKDKRLEGRLDRTVTISRSDGSFVSGAGFEASGLDRSFSFRESVEGRIESKADEPSAAPAQAAAGDGAGAPEAAR